MSTKSKIARGAAVLALLVLGAGCSGINTTGSVSPASFFLPGLLKADPPPAHPEQALPAGQPDLVAEAS